MKTPPAQEPSIRYYGRESTVVWIALVFCFAVIIGGASIAAKSWQLTSTLLFGTAIVWYLGYWALSKSRYFISPTAAGFRDAFRAQEVNFDEVRSASRVIRNSSCTLIFKCDTRTVEMPVDLFDEDWFLTVKAELLKRGITVSTSGYGFTSIES